MKNIFNYKTIVMSSILSMSLIGCGSSSNTNNNGNNTINPITIQGKVVDGYLNGATVCLDLNRDGVCGSDEPSVLSNKDGSYKLDISVDVQKKGSYNGAPLIVYGGIDTDTQEKFNGFLSSPNSGLLTNITPLTTLIQKNIESGKNLNDALENVAKITEIEKSKLLLDPVNEYNKGNTKLIQKAVAIQKAVEAIAIKRDSSDSKNEIDKIYNSLAKTLNKSTVNLDELISSSLNSTEASLANSIQNEIKNAFKNISNDNDKLNKVALTTQLLLKDVKENKTVRTIDYSKIDWSGEYIKKDLNKIGITPTPEIIDQIRLAYAGESLKNAIFKNPNKLSTINGLEEVYNKTIQKIYQTEQNRLGKEMIIAKDSKNIYPITEDTKLYMPLDQENEVGYEELSFKASMIDLNKYIFQNMSFVKEEYERRENINYVINDDEWQLVKEEDLSNIKIQNGIGINEKMKEKYILVNEKPFSYSTFLSINIAKNISQNSNNKEYILKIEISDDSYILYDKTDYNSIKDFISHHCGVDDYFSFVNDDTVVGGISFSTNENGECNIEAKSGKLSEVNRVTKFTADYGDITELEVVDNNIGTWSIITLPTHEEALVIKPYDRDRYGDGEYSFYTVFSSDANLDKALWSGEYHEKGAVEMVPVINKSAIEYLKNSYIQEKKKKLF